LLPTDASQLGDEIGQLTRDRAMPMQPPTAGRERGASHCRPMEKRKLKNVMADGPAIRYLSHCHSAFR